jgi:hypothetical protein
MYDIIYNCVLAMSILLAVSVLLLGSVVVDSKYLYAHYAFEANTTTTAPFSSEIPASIYQAVISAQSDTARLVFTYNFRTYTAILDLASLILTYVHGSNPPPIASEVQHRFEVCDGRYLMRVRVGVADSGSCHLSLFGL